MGAFLTSPSCAACSLIIPERSGGASICAVELGPLLLGLGLGLGFGFVDVVLPFKVCSFTVDHIFPFSLHRIPWNLLFWG